MGLARRMRMSKELSKGKVIAIAQGKGGSGKTTTCINLACAMGEKGYKVIIGDMDKDKPDAIHWAQASDGTMLSDMVVECFKDNPMDDIANLKEEYDFVFLDTPPNYQAASLKAVMLSDFVVLPTSDSMLDQMALSDAVAIPKMAGKKYALLANRVEKNTTASQSLIKAIEQSGDGFRTYITSRKKMVMCQFDGLWIGEYDPNGDNHRQYKKLADELIEKVGA